jgi:pimeloyl-ACP methyl ester carboxylesterase
MSSEPSVLDVPLEQIETPLGLVEVARTGEGVPVLFVHGTPGGSDTSLVMGRFLVDAGYALVAPSRPGYRGTPLGECRTVDQQADLLAELMTALGHDRFIVMAWSGGGPSAYRLAVRHPDRVIALVTFACLSGPWAAPADTLETKLLWHTGFGHWTMRFLASHAPAATVKSTLGEEGDLSRVELKRQVEQVVADPKQAAVPLALAEVVADFDNRRAGFDNDAAQFAAMPPLELERIAVPTYVLVGDADSDVDPAHSEAAVAAIPGARSTVIAQGTHIALFAHPDAVSTQAQVLEFLSSAQ